MFRKVLLPFVVLMAALYVGADFGARALADAGVARDVQTSLHLSRRPDVSLGGFPFIPKLASGRFDTVTASANGFSSGGVRLTRVDLTLHDVTASAWRLLRGAQTSIGIGSGAGIAVLSPPDLAAALRAAGVAASVAFENGKIVVKPATGAAPAVAMTPAIEHGVLVLHSKGISGPFRIPLPEVVPGVHYTGAKVEGSRAHLSFQIKRTTLVIPA